MQQTEVSVGAGLWRNSARKWRAVAFAALAVCVLLTTSLVLRWTNARSTHDGNRQRIRTDERLLGSWQSDRERTVAELKKTRRLEDRHLAILSDMFGKLTITYSESEYTTELDGVVASTPYEVLGKDERSAVIRDQIRKEPFLEVSEFEVIHFDGPNSYWLYTKLGGFREYFKRVK